MLSTHWDLLAWYLKAAGDLKVPGPAALHSPALVKREHPLREPRALTCPLEKEEDFSCDWSAGEFRHRYLNLKKFVGEGEK